jgi:hypothetical protein
MSDVLYNAYSPLCTLNQCLQQVVGQINHNPAEQFAACTDLFGTPVVSTSTPPIDVVTATATTTVSYTDIIVSLSTAYSTYESTVTSYANVLEVTTEYTTTLVDTITTTIVPTLVPKRRDGKKVRRGKCKPSSTSSEASVAPSSTTSSAPLFPVASNCPSLEEYSSACACIDAVSTTSVVTEPAVASTSTVYETVSTVIPSTVVSAVTVAVTTVVVKPATSTITSTLKTAAVSTTTVTAASVSPTQTGKLVIKGGPRDGYYLQRNAANGYLTFNASPDLGTDIAVVLAGGSPYLSSQPTAKLYLYNLAPTYGLLTFLTPAQATTSNPTITCSVSSSTGYLNCSSSNGYYTIFQCASYIYMAAPTWVFSGCTAINLKLTY